MFFFQSSTFPSPIVVLLFHHWSTCSNISIHASEEHIKEYSVLACKQTREIRTFNFSEFNISDLISLSRASLTDGDKHGQ